MYASKVCKLGEYCFSIKSESSFEIPEDVFVALRKSRPHVTLLPNLRHLEVELSNSSSFRCLLIPELFLGPTVTTVHIRSEQPECCRPEFAMLTSAIGNICPNLHNLEVVLYGPRKLLDDPLSNIFNLVLDLHHLRTINLLGFRLPKKVVLHLECLSSLKTLGSLVVPTKDVELFQNSGFPNLEQLSITADGWSSSTALLESLPCAFTSLSVSCSVKREPLSVLQGFTKALQPSFGSLSVIKLYGSSVVSDVPCDAEAVMSDMIRPLLSIKLHEISLCFPFLKLLGNSQLDEIAKAWPLLEDVTLRVKERPIGTFDGLISFVRHCPRLRKINLSIDIVRWDPDSSPVGNVCAPNLHSLGLHHPGISANKQLARSLQKVFPMLWGWVLMGDFTSLGI